MSRPGGGGGEGCGVSHWLKHLISIWWLSEFRGFSPLFSLWISSKRFALCYGRLSLILGLVYNITPMGFPGKSTSPLYNTKWYPRWSVFAACCWDNSFSSQDFRKVCALVNGYNNLGHLGNNQQILQEISIMFRLTFQLIAVDFLPLFNDLLSNQSCSPGSFKDFEQLLSNNAFESNQLHLQYKQWFLINHLFFSNNILWNPTSSFRLP